VSRELGDIGNALFGGMARYGDILALVQNSVWAGAVLGSSADSSACS
jgi:hypothetical protein